VIESHLTINDAKGEVLAVYAPGQWVKAYRENELDEFERENEQTQAFIDEARSTLADGQNEAS
jgi:hypothetical protein